MKKLVYLFALLATGTGLSAQTGVLDSTFAVGGILNADISLTGKEIVYGMAEQSDGKIVYGGYAFDGANLNCFFARVDSIGRPDSTFGTNGYANIDAGLGADDRINDIAIQADGKIVGVGSVNDGIQDDLLIIRLTKFGDMDTVFGGSGFATMDPSYGEDETGYALDIQPDGMIVVAGSQEYLGKNDAFFARFKPNGTPDSTFNVFGSVSYDINGENDVIEGVKVAADGKILGAGAAYDGQSSNVLIIRLDTVGQLDSTFSTDGKFSADLQLTQTDYAMDLDVYANGKVIVSGYMNPGGVSDGFLLRLKADGILDNTFGTSGKALYDLSLGGVDRFSQVEILPDGNILAGGYTNLAADANDFVLLRALSNGDLDTSFATVGWASFDGGGTTLDGMRCMATQADGKYLIGGFIDNKASIMRVIDHVDAPQGLTAKFENQNGLSVWPVPFYNELSLEMPIGSEKDASWELISIEGRVMASGIIENSYPGEIMTLGFEGTSLTPGFYLFRTISNGKIWSKKVLKNSL